MIVLLPAPLRRFVPLLFIAIAPVSCAATIGSAPPAALAAPAPAALADNAPARIDPDRVGIVLIDAQPSFWRIMHGEPEPILQRLEQLLVLSSLTARPLLATFEHSPQWNGWLPQRLEDVFPAHGARVVKRTFDCCREDEVRAALAAMEVEQVVVAGAETDVCVLQSVLGLLEMGYEVFLLEDCVFSNERNPGPALRRMAAAGAIPCTYKTFFFEMTKTVDPAAMPEEWRERMKEHGSKFKTPYALAPNATGAAAGAPAESK